MLNLPKSTEISKQLPKTAIYQKLLFNTSQKESFDTDISRVYIANEISERTTNIKAGENVKSIFILHVILKRKNYAEKNILKLAKMIPQNIVFVLDFEDEYQIAIFHTKLLKSDWCYSYLLPLENALDLDTVLENCVKAIHNSQCIIHNYDWDNALTLEENITTQDEKLKKLKKIEQLEKQARKEKQPRRKFELVQEINRLKESLQ